MVLAFNVFRKGIFGKVYSEENVICGKYLIIIMLPLMAKYGADVAPRLKRDSFYCAWIFLIQELGNVGTVVIGLPIALLIGLRREAIGSTLGLRGRTCIYL